MNPRYSVAVARMEELVIERQRTIAAAVFAIILGAFLIYGAGLAQPEILHNAAHDSRHSLAFPCH